MSSYFEQRMAEVIAAAKATPPRQKRSAAAPMAPQIGYVYFVRMGTFVKIGHTLDVAARMKTIQTSCHDEIHLLRLERGTADLERDFHRRFRRYQSKGEWFAIQGSLATFLKDCTGPVDIPAPIKRVNFFDGLLGAEPTRPDPL